MLPTTVESGFEEPLWAGVPEVNGPDQPVAELLLKPYTYGDIAEIQERFGICRRCDGQNEIVEIVPPTEKGKPATTARRICPVCKGQGNGKTALDIDVRLAVAEKLVKGGRGLIGRDPQTGAVRPLAYSDNLRDGLARMLAKFMAVVLKAQELGAEQDTKGAASPSPQASGSDGASDPDGGAGSGSGS
jgi:hypothetical protein